MGIDALDWAIKAQELGAGEICLNSIDADGTKSGYELNLTALISGSVRIPVIASGGAGEAGHFIEVFRQADVDGALAATIFHENTVPIPGLKKTLAAAGIGVRI